MLVLLLKRKALSGKNALLAWTRWELARNAAFALAGFALLFGLHVGFLRLLAYLETVQLIGTLLIWKLTAMLMLMTLSMVGISSLLTSLTTLYYSFDLRFLMNAPLSLRAIFIEKSLESLFFASWMIALVLVPYFAALARVEGYGWGFFGAFALVIPPFLALAGSVGLGFTLVLLYLFPSSRTRDALWVLSSLSLTLIYGMIRFAEPEKLIRPDALRVVAEYLNYLQAPTAPSLPSWWATKALRAAAAGRWTEFWRLELQLALAAVGVYAALLLASSKLYFAGYSGAQEGAMRKRALVVEPMPERGLFKRLGLGAGAAALFWRERRAFFRDVKHWSQILLVLGLIFVYLFSIQRLPLDDENLRGLVSFLNIGTAGFVIAALGLRFTYPSISIEGRSWWVVRSAPVSIDDLMRQKFLFSAIPMTALALILSVSTNYLLEADRFTAIVSTASLLVISWAICSMGIGFGALFPMFTVENIHQIESSLGGFVYMAASLFYIGANIVVLSWPMQMHFQERFGRAHSWDWGVAGGCAAAWLALNAFALAAPWLAGRRALESHEV